MGIFDRLLNNKKYGNGDIKPSDLIKYTMRCVDGRKKECLVKNNINDIKEFEETCRDNPYWEIEKKELVRKR